MWRWKNELILACLVTHCLHKMRYCTNSNRFEVSFLMRTCIRNVDKIGRAKLLVHAVIMTNYIFNVKNQVDIIRNFVTNLFVQGT
jgi:Ni,Fe-hydrogenase I cytochrome b subunit